MKAAFALVSRVISTTHVVLLGQSAGSVRGRTMEDQGACFLYASHEPPPACVRCAGIWTSEDKLVFIEVDNITMT